MTVEISHYENPAHKMLCGKCCSCSNIDRCVFSSCDPCDDNYLMLAVYKGGCQTAGCELYGRFEYRYGTDESPSSATHRLIINGLGECPADVRKKLI